MSNNSVNIFKMLEDSQAVVNGVNQLLNTIKNSEKQSRSSTNSAPTVKEGRILAIKIIEGGITKFDFEVPLELLRLSKRFISKEEIHRLKRDYSIDIDKIINKASANLLRSNKIVDIYNEDSGLQVEVSVI
ncbi:hypothetical protein BX659_107136 [Orenia metallireducens]|uniref:Uncharacterized protein n=1 Tax=Orenia metallireducens TaxID=1413210 RepID=A0A285GGZ5_9FIRM|nr:hypothetical protein [Orenia metallireducens]PRX30495.1 hypothetical protein BX659_107136 [Orenia metallireducens]SNY22870.1 hypothetical protein SAMN06265827_107136 [Orenia metallireducens]